MREPAHLSRRAIAAVLPFAALVGTAASALAPPAAAGDDAALLDLGRRWKAAWSALHAHDRITALAFDGNNLSALLEREAEGQRLFDEEQALYDAIMAMPVRSPAGLALKGQALARAFDACKPGMEAAQAALAGAADMESRAALTIAFDLLHLETSNA